MWGTVFLDSDGRSVYKTACHYERDNAPKSAAEYRAAFNYHRKKARDGERASDNLVKLGIGAAYFGLLLLLLLRC